MKKKLLLLIIFLAIGLITYSIINASIKNKPIMNGYEDKSIINGYKLRYISASNICIGFVDEDTSMYYETYISPHVYQYCYNDRYIGIKQVKPVLKKEYIETTNPNYYLIDTRKNTLYDFSSIEDYEDFIINNNIIDLCDWITTQVY